jgi:hypothetical protein
MLASRGRRYDYAAFISSEKLDGIGNNGRRGIIRESA